MSTLQKFLDDIYVKKCAFGIQEPEESDIESAVTELIIHVLEKISETDCRFQISCLLPTGGYFEETKIGNPDEFDFMAVLHLFSQPSIMLYEPGCIGCVKLKPAEPEKWTQFCGNEYLRFAEPKSDRTFDITTLSVQKYLWMLIEFCVSEMDFEVVKPTGRLTLAGFGHNTFGFYWNSFSKDSRISNPDFGCISIDVMPAIELPAEFITMNNASFPQHMYDEAVKNGVYIVPKKCQELSSHSCCQLSFSRVEMSLVRQMGEHHKRCYKILKFISGQVACLFMDSYALKTAMLHHYYNEKCEETQNIPLCVASVLNYLNRCSKNSFLPSLFVPEKSIWEYSIVPEDVAAKARIYKYQSDLLELILDIFRHIASTEEELYSFETSLEIFDDLSRHLSNYSEGKLKFSNVVKRTQKAIAKRERRFRKGADGFTGTRQAPRFPCTII